MTPKERTNAMRRVIRTMRKHKESFNMVTWVNPGGELLNSSGTPMKNLRFDCGTTCCIGGFMALTLSPNKLAENLNTSFVQDLLNFDTDIFMALAVPQTNIPLMSEFPKDHTLYNTDINIGIKALQVAVKLQNKRDREVEKMKMQLSLDA